MANTKIQSEQIVDDVALGGNPTTTTQSAGNNTTRVATTAFVTTAVSNLVDSAPSSLNTLNELAAAMNDNASFFSTVLPLSGGTMTGNIAHASDFTIDAGGDIILDADGGDVNFKDGGTLYGFMAKSNNDLYFGNAISDGDVLVRGNDGGSNITALSFDMSDAGTAIFNNKVIVGDTASNALLQIGNGNSSHTTVANFAHATDAYIEVENTTTQNGAGVIFTNVGTKKWTIQKDTSAHHLTIQDANSDNVMTFLQGGNVGMNELTPTSYYSTTFQINGSGNTSAIKMTNTATGNANNRGHDIASDSADMRLANREANGHWQVYTTAVTDSPQLAIDVTEDQEVLTPKQPSFSARLANASSVNASSNTYKLQYGGHSVPHNIGSHYSTSNYEFTAPVAGSYFFSANLRIDGFAGSYSYLTLKHEATNGTVTDRARQLDSIQATYKNHHISAVVYMTVGEKVYVTFNDNGDGSVNLDGDSWFNGFLLG